MTPPLVYFYPSSELKGNSFDHPITPPLVRLLPSRSTLGCFFPFTTWTSPTVVVMVAPAVAEQLFVATIAKFGCKSIVVGWLWLKSILRSNWFAIMFAWLEPVQKRVEASPIQWDLKQEWNCLNDSRFLKILKYLIYFLLITKIWPEHNIFGLNSANLAKAPAIWLKLRSPAKASSPAPAKVSFFWPPNLGKILWPVRFLLTNLCAPPYNLSVPPYKSHTSLLSLLPVVLWNL